MAKAKTTKGKKRKQEKQDVEEQEPEEGPWRLRAEEAGGQPKTGPGRGADNCATRRVVELFLSEVVRVVDA